MLNRLDSAHPPLWASPQPASLAIASVPVVMWPEAGSWEPLPGIHTCWCLHPMPPTAPDSCQGTTVNRFMEKKMLYWWWALGLGVGFGVGEGGQEGVCCWGRRVGLFECSGRK